MRSNQVLVNITLNAKRKLYQRELFGLKIECRDSIFQLKYMVGVQELMSSLKI